MLTASKLADELAALGGYSDEASAISDFASAFHTYFLDATAAGPIAPAGLVACQSAMMGAMIGLSVPNQGAIKIQSGVVAYWGAIIPPVAWATCIAITPPPGLAGLAPLLEAIFVVNTAFAASAEVAWNAIANCIHGACIGGQAVLPLTTLPIL